MLGGRLMRLVYLLVVGALLVVALRLSPHLTAYAMRLPAPPTEAVESAPPVTFTVAQGMSPDAIGKSLVDAGILTDIRRYNLLVSLDGAGRELRAGCYIFSKSTPASELVRRLRGGITSAKLIPIPEGRRLEEIGTIVERAGITTEADWAAALKNAPRNRLPAPATIEVIAGLPAPSELSAAMPGQRAGPRRLDARCVHRAGDARDHLGREVAQSLAR